MGCCVGRRCVHAVLHPTPPRLPPLPLLQVDVSDKSDRAVTPCTHVFHRSCLERWLSYKHDCKLPRTLASCVPQCASQAPHPSLSESLR